MIEINGFMGEGGGQIIRTSVALATLLGKKIHVFNVRAKRSPKGFRPQHIIGVKTVAALAKAEVKGLNVGSTDLVFIPKARLSGEFIFNIGTAGSISLVLQSLMPAAAFTSGKVRFTITGGTDVRWSPTIDYIKYVKLPILKKMGYNATLSVLRRGHYPKGGGKVAIEIQPLKKIEPINITDFGSVKKIKGVSHCVKLPKHVAERQAKAATAVLNQSGFKDVIVSTEWYSSEKDQHFGPGSGIILYAETTSDSVIGADALGEKGKPAEKVGTEAANKLVKELQSKMPIDRHMADMLVPYMAIADGESIIKVSEITTHLLTNVKIATLVAGVKFKIEGQLKFSGKISVKGLGLINDFF